MLNTLLSTTTLTPEAPTVSVPTVIDRLRSLFAPKPTGDTVESFIQANGGVLTDQLEREISRRYGSQVGR